MTLDDLNACDDDRFVAAVGWVFEHSPWVAEQVAHERPFASIERLHAAMTGAVANSDRERQLSLLRAHPDLGTRARMSDASTGEQAGVGIHSLTRDELDRLRDLNALYRETFGFPFLYAVKGSTAHDILAALERRVTATTTDEFDEALRQVYRIAEFRLQELIVS
jgi:2-oxo-4-hydroxy-4-carboxy-5-ureidoimidazoline decarboxylase